jgi:hypothetical protein
MALHDGYAYLAGSTKSSDFPTTAGAYDITYNDAGSHQTDGFITKLKLPDAYVRPKGATPLVAALVPSYVSCASGGADRQHGPSLANASCSNPVQTSPYLTLGTPDANGAPANSTGYVWAYVCPIPGCAAANVVLETSLSDVRCKAAIASCGAANGAGGKDYTGELQSVLGMRLTDRYNGPAANEPATVQDLDFSFAVPCNGTVADTARGSDCFMRTDANAVVPGAFTSGKRAVVELAQAKVRDGGSDGDADTTAGNQPLAVQGIFLP